MKQYEVNEFHADVSKILNGMRGYLPAERKMLADLKKALSAIHQTDDIISFFITLENKIYESNKRKAWVTMPIIQINALEKIRTITSDYIRINFLPEAIQNAINQIQVDNSSTANVRSVVYSLNSLMVTMQQDQAGLVHIRTKFNKLIEQHRNDLSLSSEPSEQVTKKSKGLVNAVAFWQSMCKETSSPVAMHYSGHQFVQYQSIRAREGSLNCGF